MGKLIVILLVASAVVWYFRSFLPHWLFIPDRSSQTEATAARIRNRTTFISTPRSYDEVIRISDATTGAVVGEYGIRDGRVYALQPEGGEYELTIIRDRPFIRLGWDIGVWGGVVASDGSGDVGRFQVGGRFSPIRLGFGVLSPDLIISSDLVGGGGSVYLPYGVGGDFWSRIGFGVWYAIPFRDGEPGLVLGWTYSLAR